MDGYIEQIIKKDKDYKDYLLIVATILGAFILIVLAAAFLRQLFIFVLLGSPFGVYYMANSRNLEFEYLLTKGELDIDKIINKSRRKRIFSANSSAFEVVARLDSEYYTQDVKDVKNCIKAIRSIDSKNIYFIKLFYKDKNTVIFFEPDKRILEALRSVNPKKVHI